MKIDLHVHTSASACSSLAAVEYVYYASQDKWPVIVTTNHYDSVGDAAFLTAECERYGILYLPAIEITTPWGDFLLYGRDLGDFQSEGPLDDFPRGLLPRPDIAVVWAHPYSYMRRAEVEAIAEQAAPYIDAIEVINGKNRAKSGNTANIQAMELSRMLKKPAVAGSDAHSPYRLFSTWTEFDDPVRTYDDLVLAIKGGRVALPDMSLQSD
jgi:predicted metal-dependent phosphoesterase TrpH